MVEGYGVRLVTGGAERRKVAVDYVTKGLASGALRPITDRTFKFDDMTEVTGIWRTAANSVRSLRFDLLVCQPDLLPNARQPGSDP